MILLLNSPLAKDNHAKPSIFLWQIIASTRLVSLADNKAASVKVPGVIIRTILRLTGPFSKTGVPTCSQIATLLPALTRRTRY